MRSTLLGCLFLFVIGCSSDHVSIAARTDEARKIGLDFVIALGQEDLAAAGSLAAAPLQFRSTRVDKDEEIAALLKVQGPRVARLAKRYTQAESFSRSDLEAGRWPRERTLTGDEAARVAGSLGVSVGGYLVRVYGGNDAGCLLAVNPVGADLRVQAVHDL